MITAPMKCFSRLVVICIMAMLSCFVSIGVEHSSLHFPQDYSANEPEIHQRFVSVSYDRNTKIMEVSTRYWNVIIEMYSIDGRLVQKYQMTDRRIVNYDLSHLQNGIYLLKFINENKVQFEKVVISD